MNLNSAIKVESFTAEAQRSQRIAEPCLREETRYSKLGRAQIHRMGEMKTQKISLEFYRKHNSLSASLCGLCVSAVKNLNPNFGF